MKSWITSSIEDWESFSSRDDMGCTECNWRTTDARGAQEGGSRASSQAGVSAGLIPWSLRPP